MGIPERPPTLSENRLASKPETSQKIDPYKQAEANDTSEEKGEGNESLQSAPSSGLWAIAEQQPEGGAAFVRTSRSNPIRDRGFGRTSTDTSSRGKGAWRGTPTRPPRRSVDDTSSSPKDRDRVTSYPRHNYGSFRPSSFLARGTGSGPLLSTRSSARSDVRSRDHREGRDRPRFSDRSSNKRPRGSDDKESRGSGGGLVQRGWGSGFASMAEQMGYADSGDVVDLGRRKEL
jgi:hypothetical protein